MRNKMRTVIIIAILLSCIGCDQTAKSIAKTYLSSGHLLSFLNDIIRVQYVQNQGGFLGLGNNFPEYIRFWILNISVAIALLAGTAYLFMNIHLDKKVIIPITLVISGGIGNLIDRIVNDGNVIDFLNVGIGHIRTGIFNIADMFIMFGASLLMICLYKGREKTK